IEEFFRKMDAEQHRDAIASSVPDTKDVKAELEALFAEETATAEEIATARRGRLIVQTACTRGELEKRLLATQHTARTFIEEQGVNTLFLALGMLCWYETDSSQEKRRSPLILVPVELERANAGDRFTLRYTEEEVVGNVSLSTYLHASFGIQCPALP